MDDEQKYNTVEYAKEGIGSPFNLKKKMEEIVAYPGNMIKGGIGAQAHFSPEQPNLAYTLGSLGFPVWLPDQVKYMDEILREAYLHPAVKGIIIHAGPEVSGFNRLTLGDKDFNNTEAGDLIDKLLQEWQQQLAEIPIQYHKQSGFLQRFPCCMHIT